MILSSQNGSGSIAAQNSPRITAVREDDVLLGDEGAHGRRPALVLAVHHLRNLPQLLVLEQRYNTDLFFVNTTSENVPGKPYRSGRLSTNDLIKIGRGARKLTGENLQPVWAEFSTII